MRRTDSHRQRWLIGAGLSLPLTMLLAACGSNMVVADTQRFAAERHSAQFRLKDGVWLEEDRNCAVDTTQAVRLWPECASGFYTRAGAISRLTLLPGEGEAAPSPDRGGLFIVVDGDPLLMELSDCPQPGDFPAEGKHALESSTPRKVAFCYQALAVAQTDEDGAVTAYQSWPVFCGPITRKNQEVTDQPFPGLKVRDVNCLAESERALFNAARASRSMARHSEFSSEWRWVRATRD